MSSARMAVVVVCGVVAGRVLPGCILPEYAPGDLPCPCIEGYRCDAVTQKCVPDAGTGGASTATGGTAITTTADGSSTAVTGTSSTTSAGTSGLGELIFADEFDADNDVWTDVGNGTWSILAGEKWQQIADATYSFTYVSAIPLPADVEVISRMRMIGGENGGAMEIVFRTDPGGSGAQYFCNWEPTSQTIPPDANQTGEMLIMYANAQDDTGVLAEKEIDFTGSATYDPRAPITMHVRVEGNLLRCWIDEIPGAELSAVDARFQTGTAGLKTYALSTAYDWFHVYALP